MNQKRKSPDRPHAIVGKVIFEFFNNDDEEFKLKSLRSLAKEARKEFNLSCSLVEDQEVENPERGILAIAICAANATKAKETLNQVLAFFDAKAPARILDEQLEETEIT